MTPNPINNENGLACWPKEPLLFTQDKFTPEGGSYSRITLSCHQDYTFNESEDTFEINPDECLVRKLDEVPLNFTNLLHHMASGQISELSIDQLPEGKIYTHQVPVYGPIYLTIDPNTTLDQTELIQLGEKGRLQAGRITVNGFLGFKAQGPHYTTAMGHVLGKDIPRLWITDIRFDKGRVYLGIDKSWWMFDWAMNYFLESFGGDNFSLHIDDNDEIDITDLLKFVLDIAEDHDLTLKNITDTIMGGHLQTGDLLDEVALKVDASDFKPDGVNLEGTFHFDNPILRNPERGFATYVPRVDLSVKGLRQVEIAAQSPRAIINECQAVLKASQVTVSLEDIAWDFPNGEIRALGSLNTDQAAIQLPGRLRPDPIRIYMSDKYSHPLVAMALVYNPEQGFTTDFTTGLMHYWSAGEEFDMDAQVDVEGQINIPLEGTPSIVNEWETAILSKRALLTENLEIGAYVHCQGNLFGNDIQSPVVNISYACLAYEHNLLWTRLLPPSDENEEPTRVPKLAMRLMEEVPNQFRGSIRVEPGQTELRIDTSGLDYEIRMPRVATSFDLDITSLDKEGTLQGLTFVINPGRISIDIDEIKKSIITSLTSRFIDNSMLGDITVRNMTIEIDPDTGFAIATSIDPSTHPFCLETTAQGDLTFTTLNASIPIDEARIKISKITFDPDTSEVSFDGDIHLNNRFIPNELLVHSPLRVNTAAGIDQQISTTFHAKNIILSPAGIIIPSNTELDFQVVHSSNAPLPTFDPQNIEPSNTYPYTPSTDGPEAGPALGKTASLLALAEPLVPVFVNSVDRVRNLSASVGYGPGYFAREWDPLFPVSISSEWERSGRLSFSMATSADADTDEVISHFQLKANPGGSLCLNVGSGDDPDHPGDHDGYCVLTHPWLKFAGLHLQTQDEGWFREAGDLVFEIDGFFDLALEGMVLSGVGIEEEDFKAAGIPLRDGDEVHIPVNFQDFKDFFTMLWPRLITTLQSMAVAKSEDAPREGLATNLEFATNNIPFDVDVDIDLKQVQALCLDPLDDVSPERSHTHISFQPAPNTRVRLSRPENNLNRLNFGPLNITNISYDPDVTHQDSGPDVTGQQSISISDIAVSEGYVERDGDRIMMHSPQYTDTAPHGFPLELGKVDFGFKDFTGTVRGYHIQHGFIDWGVSDRYDAPALTFGSEVNVIDHMAIEKELPGGEAVTLEMAPRFGAAYLTFLPGTLAIGADSFTSPYFTVKHPHLSLTGAKNINTVDGHGFLPLTAPPHNNLTTLFDPDNPFVYQAGRFSFDGGVVTMLGETMPLGKQTSLRNLVMNVENERMSFEFSDLNMMIRNVTVEFVKQLPLPEGMEIRAFTLDTIQVGGSATTSFEHGNLTIPRVDTQDNSNISITTSGNIDLSYNGVSLKSPIKVTIPHITEMRSGNNLLDRIVFAGVEVRLDNVEASLQIFETLNIDISKGGLIPSEILILVPEGTIDLTNRGSDQPIIDIPVIQVGGDAQAEGTMAFSTGQSTLNISLENIRVSGGVTFGLTVVDGPEGLSVETTAHQLNALSTSSRTKADLRQNGVPTP